MSVDLPWRMKSHLLSERDLDLYTLQVYTLEGGGNMPEIFEVQISRKAQNDLRTLPQPLLVKLRGWIDAVER